MNILSEKTKRPARGKRQGPINWAVLGHQYKILGAHSLRPKTYTERRGTLIAIKNIWRSPSIADVIGTVGLRLGTGQSGMCLGFGGVALRPFQAPKGAMFACF